MTDLKEVSRSDAIKAPLLERIVQLGGRVEGANLFEIRRALGMEDHAIRVLKSALYKLVQEKELSFQSERDHEGCDPRGFPTIGNRIYTIRR